MKNILTFLFAASTACCSAQAVEDANINNVRARINPAGNLFGDWSSNNYEVPQGSGIHSIFMGNLWIGGIDAGNTLHVAAQNYRQSGSDFFQGPVMDGIAYSPYQDAIWNRVWKINKATIDSFVTGLCSTIPTTIQDWPGNGNIALGQSAQLAPFHDMNGDGIYNPTAGDYPVIRGDQAVYFIFNDDRNSHGETGGLPMKIEIHGMAYEFHCNNEAFDNTLFLNYEVINRSLNTYHDTRLGLWLDFDLGNGYDDLVGCDTLLNAFYVYNGDANDETIVGQKWLWSYSACTISGVANISNV